LIVIEVKRGQTRQAAQKGKVGDLIVGKVERGQIMSRVQPFQTVHVSESGDQVC
jgi:hypothetical protein